MIPPIVQAQFEDLRRTHKDASVREHGNGIVIVIPDVELLPNGRWNKSKATVRILAPAGYPQAKPDCFWVDQDVRLAGGGMPANAAFNDQVGEHLLWFSWHVAQWNPNVDTLKTYLNVVRDRLRQPR
jgi:hypothetical protein